MELVIFDADGTLTPQRVGATGEFSFTLLPNVREVCARLRTQGVLLAIASNQSARRPMEEVLAQLRWTQTAIGAAVVRWATTARRRKPRPAMLLELMRRFECNASETLFVGDRETDRQAAEAIGVEFVEAGEFFLIVCAECNCVIDDRAEEREDGETICGGCYDDLYGARDREDAWYADGDRRFDMAREDGRW